MKNTTTCHLTKTSDHILGATEARNQLTYMPTSLCGPFQINHRMACTISRPYATEHSNAGRSSLHTHFGLQPSAHEPPDGSHLPPAKKTALCYEHSNTKANRLHARFRQKMRHQTETRSSGEIHRCSLHTHIEPAPSAICSIHE